jgi:hypothetical protein
MRNNVGVLGSSTATQLGCLAYRRHGTAASPLHPRNTCWQPTRRFRQPGSWSVVTVSKAAASAAASRSDTSSSTGSDTELDDAAAFATNIWEPVPPTPALGRKRKVALLLGCAMLEVTLTGVRTAFHASCAFRGRFVAAVCTAEGCVLPVA